MAKKWCYQIFRQVQTYKKYILQKKWAKNLIPALSEVRSNLHPLIWRHHRQLDNRHKYPMNNNKDYLVGQLTRVTGELPFDFCQRWRWRVSLLLILPPIPVFIFHLLLRPLTSSASLPANEPAVRRSLRRKRVPTFRALALVLQVGHAVGDKHEAVFWVQAPFPHLFLVAVQIAVQACR